jgi:heptosyltransferase II
MNSEGIKSIIKKAIGFLDYLIWLLFSQFKFKPINKTNVRRVLVINTAFLGDLLATTPLIKNLKREYKRVDIAVSKAAEGLLKNNKSVDKIITFHNKSQFINEIRGKYDAAICIWPCDLSASKLLRKANIPFVLRGNQQSNIQLGGAYMSYVSPPSLIDKHKVIENLEIARPLLSRMDPCPYEISPSKQDSEFAKRFLSQNGIKRFAIIHAAARSKRSKEWDIGKVASIADYLSCKKNLNVLIGGSKKDIAKNNKIISHIKNKKMVKNIAGKTKILQYAALIAKADLVISVSTAALHIASALNRKLIGLYSETIKIWGPWVMNGNYRTIYNQDLSKVNEEDVIKKIEELMG